MRERERKEVRGQREKETLKLQAKKETVPKMLEVWKRRGIYRINMKKPRRKSRD